jgi:hypothetical protein
MFDYMKPEDPRIFEDVRGVPGVSMKAPKHFALIMWGLYHPEQMEEMRANEAPFFSSRGLNRPVKIFENGGI